MNTSRTIIIKTSTLRWVVCMVSILLVLGFRTVPILAGTTTFHQNKLLHLPQHESSHAFESQVLNLNVICCDDDCQLNFSFRLLRCCGVVLQDYSLSDSGCLLEYIHPTQGYFLCFSDTSPPLA